MVNPSRSMGNHRRFCNDKAEAIDEFLDSVKGRELTPKEVLRLEELFNDLKAQFSRTHKQWEALATADEFDNDEIYNKCSKDYEDSKVLVDKHLKAAQKALDKAPVAITTNAPSQGQSGHVTTKIDELLKPKEQLLVAMTLEEADEWFKTY